MKLINCPVCGSRISGSAGHCPDCGYDLNEFTKKEDSFRSSHKKRLLIICPAVLAAALALLIIFLTVGRTDTGDADTSPVSASVSEDSYALQGSETESTPTTVISSEDSASSVSSSSASPSGVYDGNGHDILVLGSSGLANYYYEDSSFDEFACPWTYENNRIEVVLSRMHCTIYADVENDDFSELIFKADSANWDTEVFDRLDLDPDTYLSRKVSSADPAVTQLDDGRMTFTLGGISFTIPKQYRDPEGDFDNAENLQFFVDTDAQSDYVSSLYFDLETGGSSVSEISLLSYCAHVLDSPSLGEMSEIIVAGKTACLSSVSGYLNAGFSGLAGYPADGLVVCIPDAEGSGTLNIIMIQTSDRGTDSIAVYKEILSSAS